MKLDLGAQCATLLGLCCRWRGPGKNLGRGSPVHRELGARNFMWWGMERPLTLILLRTLSLWGRNPR